MAAQAHINRHEDVCADRWRDSMVAYGKLMAEVERLGATLRMGKLLLLKAGLWTMGILASGLVTSLWWIITRPH